MNALILIWHLSLGVTPRESFVMQTKEDTLLESAGNSMYSNLSARFTFHSFYLSGESKITIIPGSRGFIPIDGKFSFAAGYKWRMFDIGYSHYCLHPIASYKIDKKVNRYAGGDEIFIKISGTAKVF